MKSAFAPEVTTEPHKGLKVGQTKTWVTSWFRTSVVILGFRKDNPNQVLVRDESGEWFASRGDLS